MNTEQINNAISGIWPGWKIINEIGEGSYGTVYKAQFDAPEGPEFAAIKIIPVPGNEAEVDAFLAEGNDEQTARIYFGNIATGFLDEAHLMEGLKDAQNIVSIQASAIVPRESGIGWDVYIRMELLTPFTFWQAGHQPLPEEEIIRLGTDICEALSACAGVHVLHRDVKPENIFVSDDGCFKLGDFGIARRLSGTASALSQKGTYSYMAPEVYRGEAYSETADIYSLGLVLYRLANRNRTPFLPVNKQIISYPDRVSALERRMAGEDLPSPVDAGPALAAVIAKACRFKADERYSSAEKMAHDLEAALAAAAKGTAAEERFAAKISHTPFYKQGIFRKISAKTLAVAGIIAAALIALVLTMNPSLLEVIINPGVSLSSTAPSGTYARLTFATAEATSVLAPESSEIHYEPSRAIDDDIITSWQEGAMGDGIGEELSLSFAKTEQVHHLCMYTGNWRDSDRFYNNNRPSAMTIIAGGKEYKVSLKNSMTAWYVVFDKPVETKTITLRFDNVYRGARSSDLCISEIIAYGDSMN